MKGRLAIILAVVLLVTAAPVRMTAVVDFEEYFDGRALRFDIFQVGNAAEEEIILDHIYREGTWPENPAGLIEPFENGRYLVRVYEAASNRLIYSRGFECMFGEYKTTTPAIEGLKRVFKRSVRIPAPKRTFLFVVEVRDRKNIPHPLFTLRVDPADYHIIDEKPPSADFVHEVLKNGDPKDKVDFVFLAEGYTAGERDKFVADLERLTGWLFDFEPYKSRRSDFNVRGVFRPSPEPAMDEPRQGRFRKTVLDASFNALDLDRYMLVEEGHRLREMAGQASYDAIIVMVNSKRYGGGGIYNDYCISTVDNDRSKTVFVHELGHSFAGLADEYYTSEVSYNEFYPKGVEPLEPNITALLDPSHVKWAELLSPGIGIPTEYGKREIESLQAERRTISSDIRQRIDKAKSQGMSEAGLKKIEKDFKTRTAVIDKKIGEIRKKYAHLDDKVGVFEGAGYASEGLYRPMMNCIMGSGRNNEFCLVCQKAIERMIDYYTGRTNR